MILASATVLLGGIAAIDYWVYRSFTHSGLGALLGSVVAVVANLMLLVVTLQDGDSVGYPLLWAALTVGSGWSVMRIYRTPVVIPAPKRVAAAVIVSAAIAVANFGYTQLYQPYHSDPNPLLDVSVGDPVLAGNKAAFALPVSIRFENRSDVGLFILAPEFHIMGRVVQVSPADRMTPQWRSDVESGNQISRREVSRPLQMVQAGSWAVFGNYLAAHQTFTTDRIVEVPTNTKFDQLQVRASAGIARVDRLSMGAFGSPQSYSWKSHKKAPEWAVQGGDQYVTYQGRIHENNSIAEHVRDPRYVAMWWSFGDHGAGVAGTIARKGEESRPFTSEASTDLLNRYGFEFVNKGWVVRSLWDVKNRT